MSRATDTSLEGPFVFIELNILLYMIISRHRRQQNPAPAQPASPSPPPPPRRTTICKFVPQVCKAILKEFQHEYLMCPTAPEDWKKIEERFRNRWNVPHAVGELDGKHIAIKKPKKSGSEDFNYRGYFSLVLLALVDAGYKFLWVNVGACGSSSDAQIFNRSKLKRRIENGTLGLPPPEPLGPGGARSTLLPDDIQPS